MVTLSLMILLTIVAVGLLSLSSISMRTTGQTSDMATARANARMALLIALGELQKTAGLDTRVTARADLVKDTNPPVLGVWKSWEGTDHSSTGRPIAPAYAENKKARFEAWLISGMSQVDDMDTLPDTKKTAGTVALLGEKSVGTVDPDLRQIHLTPTKISNGRSLGSYAWWVGGENQKARLPRPYAPAADNAATWSVLAKTHSAADTQPFGLDGLLSHPSLTDPAAFSPADKALTIKQSDLLDNTAGPTTKISRDFFHDLSTTSSGLLTNTATGGWRKDMSLVAENWNSLPSGNLPFFRASPKNDLMFTRPESNPNNPKSILYPWSSYRSASQGNGAIYSFPAIGSWANLVSYATLYKSGVLGGSTSASSAMTAGYSATKIDGDIYNFIHKVRILPVIARVQWIYSHKAVPSTVPANAGKYDLQLLVTPVVTLWNPYNVRLAATGGLSIRLAGSLPPVISYTVGGTALPKKVTLQDNAITGTTANEARGVKGETIYTFTNVPAFAPGETRVFSPSGNTLDLVPGYNPGKGMAYPVVDPALKMGFAGTSKITTEAKFDSEFTDAGVSGVGLYLNMDLASAGGTVLAYRMLYEKATAAVAYPSIPVGKFIGNKTIAEVASFPAPFLSVTFGARMASNTHQPSKGFVQSSPFVNYTAMGKKSLAEPTIQFSYPGTTNNVNSPFEFSFQSLPDGPSPYLPEVVSGTNRGFILTGFKSSDGLSRCVIDELPGRPLSSLAELQNWDARYENPVPPYAFNLVGNSDATPLIPSNAVVNSSVSKGAENLQHDDSYCLNHILFDDWFFSSIAAEPTNFGSPSVSSSARTTYANFLKDPTKPLANRAYKAIPQDVASAAISAANANTLATKNVGVSQTSYKTIASRLEVEGMFNVNSTSVKAWRALLGHARNQKIPYMNNTGNPTLSGETDYAFSRFSVAGDVEAKQSGSSGGVGGGAEFAGYRVFTGAQLDFLAEAIVEQVRLRGPFLSLSEFVNRQLSSGDLALAGAVQTALNKLSDSTQNPFGVLQKDYTPDQLGTNITSETPPGGPSGYVFSKAAVGPKGPGAKDGNSMYGMPGWTRQADVLRSLAPILSARDDTFTIRAYGDARDATGNIIKARAVCEATLRRSREYVDPKDSADTIDLSTGAGTVPTKRAVNALFGRRFELVAFRWLSQDEV